MASEPPMICPRCGADPSGFHAPGCPVHICAHCGMSPDPCACETGPPHDAADVGHIGMAMMARAVGAALLRRERMGVEAVRILAVPPNADFDPIPPRVPFVWADPADTHHPPTDLVGAGCHWVRFGVSPVSGAYWFAGLRVPHGVTLPAWAHPAPLPDYMAPALGADMEDWT